MNFYMYIYDTSIYNTILVYMDYLSLYVYNCVYACMEVCISMYVCMYVYSSAQLCTSMLNVVKVGSKLL